MTRWYWLPIVAVIVGGVSGPSTLTAAAAAQPPIEWSDILFAFLASALGMLFVIGMQLFRREPKPSRLALKCFGIISLYIAASGLSAAVLAYLRGSVTPSSLLFLSVGIGTLLGVFACWHLYRWRFKVAI